MPGDDEGRPERRPLTDADQRRTTLARERVQAIDRRHRIARMAEQAMPLVLYHGPRPPQPIPLGRFLVEQWWWAA